MTRLMLFAAVVLSCLGAVGCGGNGRLFPRLRESFHPEVDCCNTCPCGSVGVGYPGMMYESHQGIVMPSPTTVPLPPSLPGPTQ